MARREYAGGAPPTTLAAGISATSTSIQVTDGAGYPTGATGPFFIAFEPGTANEEKTLVQSRTGNVLTVASSADRGADDTVAVAHDAGTEVIHCHSAIDADEANEHVNADAGVHGVTGDVVGTSDTQTLTNKTLQSPTLTGTTTATGATVSGGTHTAPTINSPNLTNALVRPTGATDVALTVQERVGGGTGRMVEIKNAAGTVLGYLTEEAYASLANGAVQIGDGFGNDVTLRVVPAAAADAVIVARGTASQTGDLLRVESSSGATRLVVQAAASVRVEPAVASGIALLVKALASQTGNPFVIQDSGGNNLLSLGPAGELEAAGTVEFPSTVMRPQWAHYRAAGSVPFTITNSTFDPVASTSGSQPRVAIAFVAPPSGMVFITHFAQLELNHSGGHIITLAWELRTGATLGSGTVLTAADNFRAVHAGWVIGSSMPLRASSSFRYLYEGLTPGSSYNVQTMHRTSDTIGSDVYYRYILVEPVP